MNRYPLWKYLVIGVALLLAFFYTLPNFFGEVPAVQVTPVRTTEKVDAALMQRVEATVKTAGVAAQGVSLDARGVKIRFADTDAQIKAKDALQQALGSGYTVALNLLPASPEWLTSIGALPMYLGLDLRGGVYFLLQVDMPKALDKAAERYQGDIRTLLREKKVRYTGIGREGQAVSIRFRDAAQRDEARQAIKAAYAELHLEEAQSGEEYLLGVTLNKQAQVKTQEDALKQNLTTLRNRVNELGVAEPVIQQQGIDRVVVQLPGVQDTAKAKEILGRTATLEIRMVDEEKMQDAASVQAALAGQAPFGTEVYLERNGVPVLVKKTVVLTGDYITDAQPGFDNQTNQAAVHINLDGRGARVFKNVTRENVGKRMAILLIEKGKTEVVTAPVIREEIGGGRVQITGMDSPQEANDVALLLRAGALAAPMEIVEERTVGPSLGADNIERGFNSTLYGFAAIALFMVVYYQLFGVISVLALATNMFLLVALLSLLQATLTLPGIAGIALTLGMAIDANVIIAERIREELKNGMTPQAALAAGYERAWDTILDSNITTLIAGIALFWLGSGPVRGFAVVLCLGILTSMFSAVVVSRAMVNLSFGRVKRLTKLSI
ncbi:MAG: protein-export membrane protein SecD/SecF family [bacterium]|nr:MAG: protein-export membrane protein SecD/SecF family [bacterium]KAF0150600.1 MAG: protein-export membrane protein SecD/SecF family [bacterium]KAF0169453.1 MAG: protein-export membrane protein SecD/SecF family [bacterium]TXT19751.1 MAG: protein-export membrane protein SecD/SecF family [bacterium]